MIQPPANPPSVSLLNTRKIGWLAGCLLIVASATSIPLRSQAQWAPPAELRKVPVRYDCGMTRHGVGVSIQPSIFYPHGAIFLCHDRMQAIDISRPGAARFFLVHEYGHLALRTREEAAADEWAARQLASIEPATMRAAILHFVDEGDRFDPNYGTGMDRALRIARAGQIPPNRWPERLFEYQKREGSGPKLVLMMRPGYANAAQATLSIDNKTIGFLGNLDRPAPLEMPELTTGLHAMQVSDVWIYHAGPDGSKKEIARHLDAETKFHFNGSQRLILSISYDDDDLKIELNTE
jgi:hypothetical protein